MTVILLRCSFAFTEKPRLLVALSFRSYTGAELRNAFFNLGWNMVSIKRSICYKVALIFTLFAASFYAFSEEDISYDSLISKLQDLPRLEQSILLILVQGKINISNDKAISNSLSKGGKDRLWALKVLAGENTLMENVSKRIKLNGLENYYRKETEYTVSAIRGKIDFDAYLNLLNSNQAQLKKVISEVEGSSVSYRKSVYKENANLINNLSNFIITSAKSNASEKTYLISSEKCHSNSQKYDICEIADKIVKEFQSNLPVQLSPTMIVDKFFSIDNIITMSVLLSYTKNELTEIYKPYGMTVEQVKPKMEELARNNACTKNSSTYSFINLGGVMKTLYTFKDGEKFLSITTKSCN